MRHRRHTQVEEDTGIDLTPMLDVVFIMLIFFIVTTTFVREAGVEVNRPSASTAKTQAQSNIRVAVTADGAIWIDGNPVDIRSLRAQVERLLAANPEASAVIQGDKAVAHGEVVKVMDEIRKAGIRKIAVATEQP